MAAKKKIEQTDILPESQTVETVAETTDSEAAEATEQAIETKGSENGGKNLEKNCPRQRSRKHQL